MKRFGRTVELARAIVGLLAVFLSCLVTAYAQPLYQGADSGSHRLTILGTFETFRGYALNDTGDVLGTSLAPDGLHHVVRWDGRRLVDLGPGLPGDIDNRHRVGGHWEDAVTMRAALWDPLGRLVLLENESYYSYASAISRAGHVAGYVITPTPTAINERGDVVGEDQRRALLWKRGKAVELILPAGDWAYSSAAHINRLGTIVGYCAPASAFSRATQWTDAAQPAVDLNTLLAPQDAAAGWILVQASRVNDRGSILGYASNPLRCPTCNYTFLLERTD